MSTEWCDLLPRVKLVSSRRSPGPIAPPSSRLAQAELGDHVCAARGVTPSSFATMPAETIGRDQDIVDRAPADATTIGVRRAFA